MNIRLNGSPKELPPETTVASLLVTLGLDRPGIAVAVDRQVVPQGRHAETLLAEGADVEVIRAVGGG